MQQERPRPEPDFGHLSASFSEWRARRGLSQAAVAARGGPSKPIQTLIESGSWTSSRPNQSLEAIDRGFQWPAGTSRRVLYDGFDPIEAEQDLVSRRTVGGGTQDAEQFVESPGGSVESRITNEDLFREILRSRAEYDQIRAEVRELSERVARVEQPDS